jgi:hypothetical protein
MANMVIAYLACPVEFVVFVYKLSIALVAVNIEKFVFSIGLPTDVSVKTFNL